MGKVWVISKISLLRPLLIHQITSARQEIRQYFIFSIDLL